MFGIFRLNKKMYEYMVKHDRDSKTIAELTLQVGKLQERCHELIVKNNKIIRENVALKEMFNNTADTSMIKCNNQLFQIQEKTLTSAPCEKYDTLDVYAVAVPLDIKKDERKQVE